MLRSDCCLAWLNVDKVTKKAIVHTDSCSFLRVGEKRKEAGYWSQHTTNDDAFVSAKVLMGYQIKGCGRCIERKNMKKPVRQLMSALALTLVD